MSQTGPLTQREVDKAYRLFYGEGMTLRMIMQELHCNLYELSPWLTAPAMRIAAEAISSERERAALSILAQEAEQ